jgi:predicted adenylyl cyclase CyaB
MPFEVEIKVRLHESIDEMKAKLAEVGAKWEVKLEHIDAYYLMPDGLRNFAQTDEALRIRAIKQEGEEDKADITYKGKKLRGDTKTREEIVVNLSSAEKMGQILEHLGFTNAYTIHKWREMYTHDFQGETIEITVDEVEHLPDPYMELELTANTQEEINSKQAVLFEFLKEIGYRRKDSERLSYLELVMMQFGVKF